MSRTLALDIEASHTTDEPAFDRPKTWRVFAIGLSFRSSATADAETTVLVRRDGGTAALKRLLCAMGNWIIDRRPIDCLLGYNSAHFDFPVLSHHIDVIAQSDERLASHIRDTLVASHRDLFDDVRDGLAEGESWPSLETALAARDIETVEARLDGAVVGGGTMPTIGERILAGAELRESEEYALRRYAASDVTPLHALADKLDKEREARIAAEADAVTQAGESSTGAGR